MKGSDSMVQSDVIYVNVDALPLGLNIFFRPN
jgi:hypothetical protein